MKKKSDILKNIPKSIILQTDGKRVINIYGNRKSLKNLKLKEIFEAKAYKKLKKLKKKQNKNIIIYWDEKQYEVYFKSNVE